MEMQPEIRRNEDGSIDMDHYRALGRMERCRQAPWVTIAFRAILRHRAEPRLALGPATAK